MAEAESCRYHLAHESVIHNNSKRLDDHDECIKRIERRPPAWAAWVMTGSGFIIGSLITFLGIIIKNGGM